MKNLNKEDIIKIIICCAVFAVLILIIVISNFNSIFNSDKDKISTKEKFEVVSDYNLFFSISKNMNEFHTSLKQKNNIEVFNKLDEKYISEFGINTTNCLNFIDYDIKDTDYYARNIKYYEVNDTMTIYLVTGNVVKDDFESTITVEKNIKYLMIKDMNDLIFSIVPLDNKITEKEIIDKYKDSKIEINNYNMYSGGEIISKNNICIIYLSEYLDMVYTNPKEALEITKNFNDDKKLKTYAEENNLNTSINACILENNKNETRTYTIIDENYNKYIINESEIYNYTVTITK